MLYLCVNYYREGKMKEFEQPLFEVDMKALLMLDIMYIIIEDEWNRRLIILGVKGKMNIQGICKIDQYREIELKGKMWNAIIAFEPGMRVFIITMNDILIALDILKRNEEYGITNAVKRINEYLWRNEMLRED